MLEYYEESIIDQNILCYLLEMLDIKKHRSIAYQTKELLDNSTSNARMIITLELTTLLMQQQALVLHQLPNQMKELLGNSHEHCTQDYKIRMNYFITAVLGKDLS